MFPASCPRVNARGGGSDDDDGGGDDDDGDDDDDDVGVSFALGCGNVSPATALSFS